MGPLRLLDEVGLDVAHHISMTLAKQFPDRLCVPQILDKMLKANYLGKKSGRGFYLHSKGGKTELNAQTNAFRANDSARAFTRHDLQERMVLLMINEAARCLEEQVVSTPEEVDFGMVMGTGFAPFRGGPLRYAAVRGVENVVSAMRHWSDAGAPYFGPCALLKEMAGRKAPFYGRTSAVQFQQTTPPETDRRSPTRRDDTNAPNAPGRRPALQCKVLKSPRN